jgi:broad-specificity NMP kinase
VILYVLAAPGSGKTTVTPHLRALLPGRVVLDWDAFMEPAGALAGVAISQAPHTWASYERLVRTIVEQIGPVDVVLLGVCTPHQLRRWPEGGWLLLDCADAERRARLARRGHPSATTGAVVDAAVYRALGLPVVDSTGREPREVAELISETIDPAFTPVAPPVAPEHRGS